jgi:integrase
MANTPSKYVQQQLGHSSISITLDIYGHWIQGEGKDRLDEVFGDGGIVQNPGQELHISAYRKKGSQ